MSDTARRLAKEHAMELGITDDSAFIGCGEDFLAGWDAAIEHAAQEAENHWPANIVHARAIATAIRAERSDR